MTIRYLDLVNGNDANDGTTFALRKKTLASAVTGLSVADTLRVMASPAPVSTGQSATFTNASDTVTLSSAVTANIDTCETAWTAATSVTATAQSTYMREGTNAASLVAATAFTTGLMAYHTMAASDFSAYQQISFLIRANVACGAGAFELRLCSDTAGVTAVNTVATPALVANYWTATVVNLAVPLGAAIQSVALYYIGADTSSFTLYLDNIIACKAPGDDALTHHSLISKATGREPWMAIDSINGTTIKLAGGYQGASSRAAYTPRYWGATATQTLYKREPIVVTAVSSANYATNLECGWDPTSMSTQDGQTFIRALCPGIGASTPLISFSTVSYGTLNRCYLVNSVGYGVSFYMGWTLGEFGAIACGYGIGLYQTCNLTALTDALRYTMHCLSALVTISSPGPGDTRIKFDYMWGTYTTLSTAPALYDASTSASGTHWLQVMNCDIHGHFCTFGGQPNSVGNFNHAIFTNCTIANLDRLSYSGAEDLQFVDCTLNQAESGEAYTVLRKIRTNGDPLQNSVTYGQYKGNGKVEAASDQRHTAADCSWKITIPSNITFFSPLSFPLAKIACVANEQRTVKLWCYRGDSTCLFRLRVAGGLYPGIADDITAVLPASLDTWIQLTLQFTPTVQCVVEILADAGGGIGDVQWIDDLEVT